jgi:Zn-finger nucleic acid-binding protein
MQQSKQVCPNCELVELKTKKYYVGSKRKCPACNAIITFDSKGEVKKIERAKLL